MLQTRFFADSKILGFISLSKFHRNTNKNQAFLFPKAKKPRPRKAPSHLMVEAQPQPRARPPLLRKNTLLIRSVTAAEADRALNPRKTPRPSKYRESVRRRDREKNCGWESNQCWGNNSNSSSDSNNDSISTSFSNTCCCNNDDIQMQNCKVPTRKKTKKRTASNWIFCWFENSGLHFPKQIP